jgi:hypothetical protein
LPAFAGAASAVPDPASRRDATSSGDAAIGGRRTPRVHFMR